MRYLEEQDGAMMKTIKGAVTGSSQDKNIQKKSFVLYVMTVQGSHNATSRRRDFQKRTKTRD